jgi:hypothetical protein
MAWQTFLTGNLSWSIGELFLFSLSFIVPSSLLLQACLRSTAVTTQEDGMMIRTCFFFWFYVPWQEVTGLWSYSSRSLTGLQTAERTLITIQKGLTPLHRGFPRRISGKWEWPRGFTIFSEAEGYSGLLQVIEEHAGEARALKEFFVPTA